MTFKKLSILALAYFLIGSIPVLADTQASYRVLKSFDHDSSFFTQGFEIDKNVVYETSGLYGKSRVRRYQLNNNRLLAEAELAEKYFAEGLTLLNDTLYVITWKEGTLLMLDPESLNIQKKKKYKGEGWGLANDNTHLIMSNGSDTIYFRDPATFGINREIKVTWNNKPVQKINELEYVNGFIWANVWFSPAILKIDPTTGEVDKVFDLSELAKKHTTGSDNRVLNGIAYDEGEQAFWVTGKFWKSRYLIEFE